MGLYQWVHHNGEKLYEVGILPDGSLRNPRGYPEDIVRAAVLAADTRRHERRSVAAKEAAKTRARQQERQILAIARRIVANGKVGTRDNCVICERGLGDFESIERGIGSECWQGVLEQIEKYKAA
jgi:hypothetical protein